MSSRVLVVDPHAHIVDLLRKVLELAGYEVETASSTARANQHTERHECSVALVNLTLPDSDGPRLLSLLKSRNPSVEVILMGQLPVQCHGGGARRAGGVPFSVQAFRPGRDADGGCERSVSSETGRFR